MQAALHPDPALRASLWYVKEHAWLHIPVSAADYRFQVRHTEHYNKLLYLTT